MKRPRNSALPPWRSKKASTRASRAGAEPQTGAVTLEERASQATAEQQAHEVSRHRRRADQRDHGEQGGVAALGGDPAEHQRQLTVDHEAEERGGLEEHQRRHGKVDPAAQGACRVRQLAGQVGDGERTGRDRTGKRDGGGRRADHGDAVRKARPSHRFRQDGLRTRGAAQPARPPPRAYSPAIATRLPLALATCLVLAAPAVASPAVDARAGARKPILLLIHGGGFAFDDPTRMDDAARVATARGFRPVRLEYTLWNLPRALADANRAAKRYARRGPLFAYGESAGGTLAALVARPGRARAAVAYAPVSNLVHWLGDQPVMMRNLGATRADLRRGSPALRRATRPILAMVPEHDSVVICPGQLPLGDEGPPGARAHCRRWT